MEQALYELPEGWVWKELIDLLDVQNGFAFDSKKFSTTKGMPLIRIRDLKTGVATETNYVGDYNSQYIVKSGDYLIGMDGEFRCYRWKGEDALLNQRVCKLNSFSSLLDSDFVLYGINKHLRKIEAETAFVTVKHIAAKQIKAIKFPLPPLNEQKRIVAKLDALFNRIDTAITQLQQILELTKALFSSALDEVFLPENNKGRSVSLNQIATVARGKSKHRPRNDKTLFGGDYPFIQTGDVRNAGQYLTAYSTTYNANGLAQSKLWPEGTICLTIAANIGEVAILGIDACFPDSVVGISSDSESNEYIYYFLTTLQQHLDSKATMAAQKNINLRVLSEIKIPLPSLGEQKRIVIHLNALSERTHALETATQEKLNDLTTLKASLLDVAFKGQL